MISSAPIQFPVPRRWLRVGLAFAAGLAVGLGTLPARAASPQQECDGAELHAMAKRLRSEAACLRRFVRKPGSDPLGAELDACRDAARDRFATAIDAARQVAEEEGVECSSSLASLVPETAAVETSDALAEIVLDGWDENAGERRDDKLRARLLREVAKLAKRHLKAESKHRLVPDDERRLRRLAKAELLFHKAAKRHLKRAAKQGVAFAGVGVAPLRNALVAELDALVDAMSVEAGPGPGPVLVAVPFDPLPFF